MRLGTRSRTKVSFGDFQTPGSLAKQACALLRKRGIKPASVLEPNCGTGSFLLASLDEFPTARQVVGVDINPRYVSALRSALCARPESRKTMVVRGDFYTFSWPRVLGHLEEPILVLGNPPWVTNAELSTIGGGNLPEKSNFQRHSGLDAITGKSNFDISEWMLLREIEWLDGRCGTLAMLCKTAVARKVLYQAWKRGMRLSRSDVYPIDAMKHFGAAVDACLFVCDFTTSRRTTECFIHKGLQEACVGTLGLRDGRLVADASAYDRWKFLSGPDPHYKWRSGIKHDCAKIMEFRKEGEFYRNGLGELIELEEACTYPMLKSSDLANDLVAHRSRWMLVTQRFIGQDTSVVRDTTPKTWAYLERHAQLLQDRASSIYEGRPPFSIFGVGEYSFAPWKVAISAFYKKLDFKVVGPMGSKPVVLDDTCYFLACQSQDEAECVARLLNSPPARSFYHSLIFWDAKRPVTIEILSQLSVPAVARELGLERALNQYMRAQPKSLFDLARQ